jgi:nickel-dependent lactate racemase
MAGGDAVTPAIGGPGAALREPEIRAFVHEALGQVPDLQGQRLLLIVPDHTRSGPVGPVVKAIHAAVADVVERLDVLIALGTHPPMTEAQINERLELTPAERAGPYAGMQVFNHRWDDPDALATLGTLPARDIEELTAGLFGVDVEITINRLALAYDRLCILGPVFPHEVVGFSGGNKYLFPGISGRAIIDFFHWLGAVITNPKIIGNAQTPVRAVLDRAARLVPTPRLCLAMVVRGEELAGLSFGTPEEAWAWAAAVSAEEHIRRLERPFRTVLSCAPAMYDDLWTGGKCMYKLEPVVADGGELIIYAPHITEVSVTHGRVIEEVGYHTRDYFLAQWERFGDYPWGVLAHSTHVRGIGTYEAGVERGRIAVTLATGIPPETCERIGLGYRDPAEIDPAAWAGREAEGILCVRKAGEVLYKLADPPAWQLPTAAGPDARPAAGS